MRLTPPKIPMSKAQELLKTWQREIKTANHLTLRQGNQSRLRKWTQLKYESSEERRAVTRHERDLTCFEVGAKN